MPLLVAAGAAVGAPARYFTDRYVQSRHDSVFPWGTLTVNAVGCLILGALVGAGTDAAMVALVGTGFCGALTTYSTFGFETHRLIQDRSYLVAGANVAASLVVGLGAASLGFVVGGWLAP